MAIEIRPLVRDDIAKAAEILYRSWHESFSKFIPAEVLARITPESSLAAWDYATTVKNADLVNLAAFDGTDLVGTISIGRQREKYGAKRELWAMHVDSRWQRKGVGRKLFEAGMKDNDARGAGSMALCCIDKNTSAIQFYEAMGGEVQPGLKKRDGFDEVVILWKGKD
ncbi:MAG: GNAT family N-acetyltransferase [Proteobacteria bacterium]|nr:MAG: GNAT family N-acetyltransferase [Pseudomonadota bacterium]